MVRINEKSGLAPSEQLRQDMGKLIEEMTRDGSLVTTAILEAKSMQEAVELTKRFLRVHGPEWDVECEVRQLGCSEVGAEARAERTAA